MRKKVEDTSQVLVKEEETADVWQDIATAVENWTQRISIVVILHRKVFEKQSKNR